MIIQAVTPVAQYGLKSRPKYDQVDHIFVLGYDTDVTEAEELVVDTDEILKMQTAGI